MAVSHFEFNGLPGGLPSVLTAACPAKDAGSYSPTTQYHTGAMQIVNQFAGK